MKKYLIALLFAVLVASLFGGTTGKIIGVVTDENGDPMPGANVIVDGTQYGAETDADGYFYIIGVRAGNYELIGSFIGYKEKRIPIKVKADLTAKVNFKLVPSSFQLDETVIEVEVTERVDKDITTSVRNIDMASVETQAVVNVEDLLKKQAGVKADAAGNLHFRGGRSGEVNYVIDGVSISDPTGEKSSPVDINFANVASFDIQKGVPNAEYGNALSGSVNVVYKVGDQKVTSGMMKYSTDSFFDNKLDYQKGEFMIQGPFPFLNLEIKPTYMISTDLKMLNGLSTAYYKPGTDDYFEFDDDDFTGLGFEMPQKKTNTFNFLFKTQYDITSSVNLTATYQKAKTHNYGTANSDGMDFLYGYKYSPETVSESRSDQTFFNVQMKHVLNQNSFYDLTFSYYNREFESLPGGKKPDEFILEDSLDTFDVYEYDINGNDVRDGGDAEGYKDVNKNGYFDREYFIDANNNGKYNFGEWFIDANMNRKWDGDELDDSNGNKEWDYWENGKSYNGYSVVLGETYTFTDGAENFMYSTVSVQGNILEDEFVEGYRDINGDGHYNERLYNVSGDEPFIDGDIYNDTGEPFIDEPRWYNDDTFGVRYEANGAWDDVSEVTLPLSYLTGDPADAHIDTTINYEEEVYADLPSSYGSVYQPDPSINLNWDDPNGIFDEYEAYCFPRSQGTLVYEGTGWTPGYGPNDNSPYVEFVGSYAIYRAPREFHNNPVNIEAIEFNEYSQWEDTNGDGVINYANGVHDNNEQFIDYNFDNKWNQDSGFLRPGSYGYTTYSLFDNTVMKLKGNYTNQVNKFNLIKTGFEVVYNDLDYYEIGGVENVYNPTSGTPAQPGDPYPNRGDYKVDYAYKPIEFAYYIQDKMEYEDLVLNMGVRMDMRHHDQDAVDYYNSQRDEGNIGYEEELKRTIVTVSPRFGVSHSISETSKLFFSYGHLYQLPNYTRIYEPNTKNDAVPLFGNMNLKYEKNVQYELGYQQEFGEYMIDVTGYYKDIYDMVNTKAVEQDVERAAIYFNSDYGKTRGVEISLDKALSDNYSWSLSYELAFAFGKSSSAISNYNASLNEEEVAVKEFPLAWDERHSLNLNTTVAFAKGDKLFDIDYLDNWSLSTSTDFGSGKPFTPTTDYYDGNVLEKDIETNSERMDWTSTTDVRFKKSFEFDGEEGVSYGKLSFEFDVFNIFNKRNVESVYADTGDPFKAGDDALNDNPGYEERYANPNNVSEKRYYRVGVSYTW